MIDNILALILAGGEGQRLSVLSEKRAKPAVPFAGKYRIVDFTLSNCVNSGIYNVALLTQYQPLSLVDHIGIGTPWEFDRSGRVVRVLQAYLTRDDGRDWYVGTADAVYQNLGYVEEQRAELVLILSGDQIYSMNYADMVEFHRNTQADVTLAVTHLPGDDLERFGTVTVNEAGQVIGFQEKVEKPMSNMVSMGVYLFKKDVLQKLLDKDSQNTTSNHDFGLNIIPGIVGKVGIFAYKFDGYWRDIGTVHAYWRTNKELLEMTPSPLFNPDWPIRTKEEERPPAIVSETANVINSLVSNGCVIEGRVEHSVLSPGVMVAEGAVVKNSIILNDSAIGQGSIVDYSILDKEVIVEAGCYIGFGDDFRANRREPETLNTGITLVGKRASIILGARIGRNCVICCDVKPDDFLTSEIRSGETVEPQQEVPI